MLHGFGRSCTGIRLSLHAERAGGGRGAVLRGLCSTTATAAAGAAVAADGTGILRKATERRRGVNAERCSARKCFCSVVHGSVPHKLSKGQHEQRRGPSLNFIASTSFELRSDLGAARLLPSIFRRRRTPLSRPRAEETEKRRGCDPAFSFSFPFRHRHRHAASLEIGGSAWSWLVAAQSAAQHGLDLATPRRLCSPASILSPLRRLIMLACHL